MRPPIRIGKLSKEDLKARDDLDRQTKGVRLRTRAQIMLLAAEQQVTAPQIAKIGRKNDQTVRNGFKRYQAEGIKGLFDAPRPGSPGQVTPAYKEKLIASVRRRPRSLDLPYAMGTLARLADYLAEETGLRVSSETGRVPLKAADIVISRPQPKITSPDPEYPLKKRRPRRKETL